MKDKKIEEDDIVVADMSWFDRKKKLPEFAGNDEKHEALKGSNLAAFISGALSASLLIGLAYAAGLGLVILILYLLFLH